MKKPLSPFELKVLGAIPADGRRVTTADIASRIWPQKLPEHALIRVSAALRSLSKKTLRSRPRVMRSGRRGPYPGEAWVRP